MALQMPNVQAEFTAVVEQHGEWFEAHCVELPGASGHGATAEAARDCLAEAVALVLAERLQDQLGDDASGWQETDVTLH